MKKMWYLKKKKSCINLGLLSENCIYTIGIFYCLFENFVQMSECHFVKRKKVLVLILKISIDLMYMYREIYDSEFSFSKAAILTGNKDTELLIGENEIECLSKTVCIKVSGSK